MARMSEERLAELREAFEAADGNGDGHIDKHEFIAFVRDFSPDIRTEVLEIGFDETDTNHDGVISFEEFVGWWSEFGR